MSSLVPFSNSGAAIANTFFNTIDQHWASILDNFFSPFSIGDLKNKVKNAGYPKLDVYTRGDEYVIEAAVPGVNPDNLSVEVFEGDAEDQDLRRKSAKKVRYVRISGQVAEEYRRDGDGNWIRKELCRRAFSRTLALPDVITGDPAASIKDGIMSLVWQMPRAAPVVPEVRKIEIKKA